MRQILLLSLLIFTANQLWAQPANDNWKNALEIKINENKLVDDTINVPFVSMQKASVELGETFHPIIKTLALDQKSVWYKFELKGNHRIKIRMLQKDTLIQPVDVGLTVYAGDLQSPSVGTYNFINRSYPTLTQMGSFSTLFKAGVYYIQLVSRKNVVDSIALELTSIHNNVLGNTLNNAADLNNFHQIQYYELGIDSLAEKNPYNLDTLIKSAYVKFTTSDTFDRAQITVQLYGMAMVLYEVGIGNNPNDWKIIRISPYGTKNFAHKDKFEWSFNCGELKQNTTYLIKFLGASNDAVDNLEYKEFGNSKTSGTDPVNDLSKSNFNGTQYKIFNQNYACGNTNALKICPTYKHYLNDTIRFAYLDSTTNPIDTVIAEIPIVKSGGFWQLFNIKKEMKLDLEGDYLVFKGQASKNICELGPPIDITDKCLFPGEKYTVLNLKAPHQYNANDTLYNGNIGTEFTLNAKSIQYRQGLSFFYKKSLAQNLGVLSISKHLHQTFQPILSDTLGFNNEKYFLADDTLTGKFSFINFEIKDSAYLGYFSIINFGISLNVYKLNSNGKDEDATSFVINNNFFINNTPNFTEQKCPPGKYLMVFNEPFDNSPCSLNNNYYIDGYVVLSNNPNKKPPADTTKNPCAHPYYAAKLAMKINNLLPLSHQYLSSGSKKSGEYNLPTLCVSESYSTLDNPLMYNYQKYKNKINGFAYYVFKIDELKEVSIFFNTNFQLIKGDISKDSSIATKNNVLHEFGNLYHECTLKKGTFSIIAIEDGMYLRGTITVKETGESTNNYARFAQDLGVISKSRNKVTFNGVISCNTSQTLDRIDTWHTFQLNQPGRVSIINGQNIRLFRATNGNEISFDDVKKLGLVDSTYDDLKIETLYSDRVLGNDSVYFVKRNYEKQRFYIQYLKENNNYEKYERELVFKFDSLTSSKGDYCENAISATLTTNDSIALTANINIHTIGEGPGETNESNLWLDNVSRYKTTWFKIEAKNVSGSELVVGESIKIFRLHYGSCSALTPGAVSSNNNSSFNKIGLECIGEGNYYVQVFNYIGSTIPNITLPIEIKESTGPCRKIDINKVLANFTSEGGCPNTAVNFTNLSTWGDNMRYIWDFGDGTIDTINPNPIHKYPFSNTLDTYSVQLIAVNKISNRSDTIIRQIVVGQLDASIVGDTLLCDSKGEFYANSKNLAYSWYTWHNLNNTIYKRGLGVDRYLTYYGYEKENWLYLDAKLGNCIQTDSLLLYSARNLNYTPNGTVFCPNDKQLLFVNPLLNAGYTIKDGANNIIDSMVIKKPGRYKFQTYIDGKKCLSNLQFQVDSFIKPSLIDSPLCYGEPIAKNLLSSDWYLDSSGTTYNRIFQHNRAQNEYYYKYIRRDSVCSWQYDTLRIKSFIDIPVEFADTTLCADDSLKIDLTKYDLNSFSWYNSSSNDTIKIINETGRYMLQMTKDECQFADTFIVTKEKDLSIHLANQQLCFQDEEVNLNITDFDSLFWSNESNDPEQIFSKEGTYWLQAFKNGCVVSDTFTLTNYCEPKLFIPNAFSPNGDAENPVFIAKGDKIQKFQMRIYNRDGALIFYTDDINEGWDGRIKNLDVPMASYYYVVEYSTEQGDFVKSGNLLLLR